MEYNNERPHESLNNLTPEEYRLMAALKKCVELKRVCIQAYLAVVLDLFARKPVGWAMSFSPDSKLTIKALEMAWETRGKPAGVMFHSDSNNADVSLYHHLVCRLTRLV